MHIETKLEKNFFESAICNVLHRIQVVANALKSEGIFPEGSEVSYNAFIAYESSYPNMIYFSAETFNRETETYTALGYDVEIPISCIADDYYVESVKQYLKKNLPSKVLKSYTNGS